MFDIRGKKYIIIKDKWSYFSDRICPNFLSVTAPELIEWVNYVIDNSYIYFQDAVYRQVVGIHMGTNCAPYFANIFLHVYEYDYISKLIRNNDINTVTKMIASCSMMKGTLMNILY